MKLLIKVKTNILREMLNEKGKNIGCLIEKYPPNRNTYLTGWTILNSKFFIGYICKNIEIIQLNAINLV